MTGSSRVAPPDPGHRIHTALCCKAGRLVRAAPPHSPAAPRTIRVFPPRLNVACSRCSTTLMSKIAVKKTAGVLGDDLALSAQQVADVAPHRELPVV